jgi:two-component system, NtrC family, response regulator AtoC
MAIGGTCAPARPAAGEILVVDDDDAIRSVVRLTLEDEGYRVATAIHGGQALERIRERAPAVVLLDLNMPVMDGWQLLSRLRELGLDVPVVFMTAGGRAREEAERLQVAGYLAKPFDVTRLLDTVARFTTPNA